MSRPNNSPNLPLEGSRGFLRGARLGIPIFLGYLPIGAAFGIVANASGFTVLQAASCSALALAGAGQFIGLSLYDAGAGLAAIITATSVVNLRYVLFGATVTSHLKGIPFWKQSALAYTLTDETFAINVSDLRTGHATPASMAGVGMMAFVSWVLGTTLGAGAASVIGDPSRWGVDFAMPAMFTALLVGSIEDRQHLVAAVIAAVLALILSSVLPGSWFLIAASMGAATVAAVICK